MKELKHCSPGDKVWMLIPEVYINSSGKTMSCTPALLGRVSRKFDRTITIQDPYDKHFGETVTQITVWSLIGSTGLYSSIKLSDETKVFESEDEALKFMLTHKSPNPRYPYKPLTELLEYTPYSEYLIRTNGIDILYPAIRSAEETPELILSSTLENFI